MFAIGTSRTSMRQHDIGGIDVFKFIMAFAVIAIHAPEYLWPYDRSYSFFADWFIRLAVPFFYIASGFLINEKLHNIKGIKDKRKYLKSKSIKLYRIWLLWLAIYLPLFIYGEYRSQESIGYIAIRYVEDILLTGHSVYSPQLWFLYSMAFVVLLWSCATGHKVIEAVLVATFTISPIYIRMSELGLIANNEILHSINLWILGGGLPIFTGAILNRNISRISGMNSLISATCFLLLSMAFKYFNLLYWPFFGGIGIFIFSYNLKPTLNLNYLRIRQESMWIYYTHMYIVIVSMIIIRQLNISMHWLLLYLFNCVASWIVAGILYKLSNTDRFNGLLILIK